MRNIPQIVRFLVLGGAATTVSWLVRFPLSLVMPFPAAVIVAYTIGMSMGFTFYRAYVFPTSSLSPGVQLGLFFAVNAAGVVVVTGVSLSLLQVIFPSIGFALLPEASAHAIGLTFGAATNFLGHKYLTFRVARPRPSEAPRSRQR